ncbi:MAG: hypothetical protein ACPG19_06410 [Saprospiraceae bacterium]
MTNTNKIIIAVILFLMFSPIIIAFGYQWIMKLKGIQIHEGNSAIFSFFWFSFFTIPAGILALFIMLVYSFINNE